MLQRHEKAEKIDFNDFGGEGKTFNILSHILKLNYSLSQSLKVISGTTCAGLLDNITFPEVAFLHDVWRTNE